MSVELAVANAMNPGVEIAPSQSSATPLLLQVWHAAQRWKWVLAAVVGLALALGVLLTVLATPQYSAVARVEISRASAKVTNVEGVQSDEVGRDQEFYQTQYALLQARSLAERVERQLRLGSKDEFFAAHGVDPDGALAANSQVMTPTQRRSRSALAIDLLLANIEVSPIARSSLVDITYTSGSPELSAQIANAWVDQFIGGSIDRRFESTAAARRYLEQRLGELRGKLEQSERDLVNYAGEKGIVTLSSSQNAEGRTTENRTLVAEDLAALNASLADAKNERIAADGKLRAERGSSATQLSLANPTIATLRQRRAELSADYAKLMVQFEPGYPPARAIHEQIRSINAAIAEEEGRVNSGSASTYQAALARENGLQSQVDTLKQRLATQQRDSIQYNIFQREADTNRELYDGLLQRYKEIGVAGIGSSNIFLVDAAKIPTRPSSPKLIVNILLALAAGLVIAMMTAVALEQIDEGVREPDQIARHFHVPLLGSVPDERGNDLIDELSDVKSSISEAYLSIRSNLAFSSDHGVPRSLMVTSTRPSEGKTTSSYALALVLARVGKKVALIDADMRSPSTHKIFGMDNVAGLSNFLAGNDDWQKLLRPTGVSNLTVMTAGPTPPSAAELLSSDRLIQLIRSLAERFDHVIVDSPPILGLADAPLISRAVEGCIAVVESRGVAVRGVRLALDRLRSVRAHIFGVILTKLDSRQAGYGYGYGYSYGGKNGGEAASV